MGGGMREQGGARRKMRREAEGGRGKDLKEEG